MGWITLDSGCSPVLDRDQNSTGIGTIVWASGVDDLLHALSIIGESGRKIGRRDPI
jgi:hypothetical protein